MAWFARRRRPAPDVPDTPACARCRHRDDARRALEQGIAGLIVFGSGYGASAAGSRLCRWHDRLVGPDDRCTEFAARVSGEGG